MFYYKILLNCTNNLYTYKHNDVLQIGNIVETNFAGKTALGIVYQTDYSQTQEHDDEIKNIQIIHNIILSGETLSVISFLANYYLCNLNAALKLCLPFKTIKLKFREKKQTDSVSNAKTYKISQLTTHQQQVVDKLPLNFFNIALLEGKTGSGKTQVYINQMAKILNKDPTTQVLVLIPEIGLSDGVLQKLQDSFDMPIALWNSSVYEGTKQKYYQDIYSGKIRIILGTRSALFLPFKNLKYIVVDEEHDQSYKQEEIILYHARDIAIYRAKLADCPILLVSATPSVESEHNARLGRYQKLELHERFFEVEMPQIQIMDLKKEKLKTASQFTQKTIDEIDKVIKNGKQALVFIQRRGYCPIVMCPLCWYKFECSACDVFLAYHQNKNVLKCHQCGKNRNLPKVCPSCGGKPEAEHKDFLKIGFGVERIEEELKNQFMFEPIITLTSDTTSTNTKLAKAIEQIENKQVSIIIGTQLISKGFHFKHVDLVCVLDADMGSNTIDFRGKERTYQLITQVAGRAGREINQGKVIIQTYSPQDKVLAAIQCYDSKAFYDNQIAERQKNELPPFTNQIAVIISGKDKNQTIEAAHILKKELESYAKIALNEIASNSKDTFVEILGPAEAQIFYIRSRFRYRMMIVFTKDIFFQKYIKKTVNSTKLASTINIKFDVNPQNFF